MIELNPIIRYIALFLTIDLQFSKTWKLEILYIVLDDAMSESMHL